jgi:hypothetical protein
MDAGDPYHTSLVWMDWKPSSHQVAEPVDSNPAIQCWNALENLTHPNVAVRRSGLSQLADMGGICSSPLVAYMVVSRLSDPQIDLRCQVIRIVADSLRQINAEGRHTDVRDVLVAYLNQMRTRQIYSLLQVIVHDESCAPDVARLLYACPHAGAHLSSILGDRRATWDVRQQAVRLIRMVGYIDTMPILERMALRLEARLNGHSLATIPLTDETDEIRLLPEIRETITALRAP